MASERDREAARLRRAGWSYTVIGAQLGYPDCRAAHRGVARGLAEPAAADAVLQELRLRQTCDQLDTLQRRLWDLLERHQPYAGTTCSEARAYFRIVDALFRVVDTQCRLRGLYTRPWRCDHWWRRDVPVVALHQLQVLSARLEREARIPVRWRRAKVPPRPVAPVLPLRAAEPDPIDVDALIPASVRRLLDQAAA